MRCIVCHAFSWRIICPVCYQILSKPSLNLREIGELKIYSFYGYDEARAIIHSKHTMCGAFAYRALANLSFKRFGAKFSQNANISANIVPIDDRITNGYSHTAILARALKNRNLTPIYRALHATSKVSYSGKDLNFRLKHPRNFKILNRPKEPVILVDDVITTGTTLLEADKTLKNAGCEVMFALVLADARY